MSDPEEEGSPPEGDKEDEPKIRTFKFPAHQSHMLSLAKMCRDNKTYADCVIQCDSGVKLKAHRLVLGSASSFLKLVFDEVPSSLSEASVMVPGVKFPVVKALVDFLYTGEMSVSREDTTDLQLLLDTLRIDPSLITVGSPEESSPSSPHESKEAGKEEDKKNTTSSPPPENPLKRKNSDEPFKEDQSTETKKPK